MVGFTFWELDGAAAGDAAADVATLADVAAAEAEGDHQLVHDAGDVVGVHVLVKRGPGREGVAWKRWDDDVVREVLGRILLLDGFQHGEKLEEAARPSVIEGNGDGIFLLGEESNKVDCILVAVVVLDWESVVGKGVDVILSRSPWTECEWQYEEEGWLGNLPVKVRLPDPFGVDQPISGEAKSTILRLILKNSRTNLGDLQ